MYAKSLGEGVELRRIGAPELPELMRCLAACPEAPAWSREAWQSFLVDDDPAQAFQRVAFGLQTAEGALAGLLAGTCLAPASELEMVLVPSAWRRRGFGRLLVEHWLGWARAAGASEALLEVRASNIGAQALYRTCGFVEQGRRAHYYQHPVEDALLMGRALV